MSDIAIIVPLYNKGAYIKRALHSVLNQSSPFNEVVVVDDGSTDDGPNVVLACAKIDSRVRLVRQENCGPAGARNRGIRETSTDLVAFLDADDEWDADFLARAEQTLQMFKNAAVAAAAYRISYPSGTTSTPAFRCGIPIGETGILQDYFRAMLAGAAPLWTSSVVLHRYVFE